MNPDLLRRTLTVIIVAAALWCVATLLGAGFFVRLGPWVLSSHEPVRPAALAALASAVYVLTFGVKSLTLAMQSVVEAVQRLSAPAAVALAVLTVGVGLRWATYAASGADSYGYVSQADSWLGGHLRIAQPWVGQLPLPDADRAFAPLGYRPGTQLHTIVPTYPAGVPIMMAIAKLLVGIRGPYIVVPLLGGFGVWLTYCLGRGLAAAFDGLMAAALLATSPAFVFQLLLPMSDIAAMTFWTLAAVLLLDRGRFSVVGAGLAASVAILIRPNLMPLTAVYGLSLAFPPVRTAQTVRAQLGGVALFAAAVVPGIAAVSALNWYLYGGPLRSGYGSVGEVYELANAAVNARRYAAWLWETQTRLILLAPLVLVLPGVLVRQNRQQAATASPRLLLSGIMVAVTGCYVFYGPFEDWSYLRFLLPAFPAMLVASVAGVSCVLRWLPAVWRSLLILLLVSAAAVSQGRMALERGAFKLQQQEQRYIAVARQVELLTPPDAMIICLQHSGSVRYYAHRKTLRNDWLLPDWLDRAVELLRERGYHPYILLEDWEETPFRTKFGGLNRLGQLDIRSRLQVSPGVWLHDALDATARRPPA
jgi:hypothetical protein